MIVKSPESLTCSLQIQVFIQIINIVFCGEIVLNHVQSSCQSIISRVHHHPAICSQPCHCWINPPRLAGHCRLARFSGRPTPPQMARCLRLRGFHEDSWQSETNQLVDIDIDANISGCWYWWLMLAKAQHLWILIECQCLRHVFLEWWVTAKHLSLLAIWHQHCLSQTSLPVTPTRQFGFGFGQKRNMFHPLELKFPAKIMRSTNRSEPPERY